MTRPSLIATTTSAVLCLALSAWSADKPEAAASDSPKASEAVAVNGLETVVTPEKASYEADKVMKFTVTIKNTDDKELTVGSMPKWSDWLIVATNEKKEAFRYSPSIRSHLVPMMKLDAGKTLTCNLSLMSWWRPLNAEPEGPHKMVLPKVGAGIAQGQPLPAGKYNLVITIDHSQNKDPMWIGKIVTSPVEFTVLGAEAGPASAPAAKASDAVTVQGLEVVVTPAKVVFPADAADDPPTFEVTIKNTTEEEVQVGNLPLWEKWQVVATDADGKAFQYAPAGARKVLIRANIAAGKTLTVPATFDLFAPQDADNKPAGKMLAPGKYKLVITIDRDTQQAPQWTGKIVTNPVEFRVAPANAPAADGAKSAGEWTPLYKDMKWYKDQEGTEETFTGTLEANAVTKGPSIRMRTLYYKLGERGIYTGARKVQALDDLIGKKVEIRGKAVALKMGGTNGEIWPADVREAK